MTTSQRQAHERSDMPTTRLLGYAVEDAAALLRGEIALAKAEIRQSVDDSKASAGMFGAAGALAGYGGVALVAAAIAGLAVVFEVWLAALIVAIALFALAGIAAALGKRRGARIAPPLGRAKVNLQRDVEAVKEARS